jgi:hypothetical protein
MKVFFFLGQTFFEQSVGIAREIKSQYPDSTFGAIVAARSNLMDELNKINNPKFSRYDWLSGLEEKWLSTPLDTKKLKSYEEKLGTDVLRRIVTADREIGVGFVSCGIVERTELMDRTIHNDDVRWSYVVGLLDYYFGVFEKDRPDVTFAYCVAGAVAFALAEVSRYFKIPFIQPVLTRIGNYHILDDNIKGLLTSARITFEQTAKNPELVAEFLPEATKYLQDFRGRPESPGYSARLLDDMMEKNKYSGLLKVIAIDLARWAAIRIGLKGTRGVLRQRYGSEILKFNLYTFRGLREILKKKTKVFSSAEITSPYIYYALQVDPESSTMVFADMHTDQMAVIEAIAKSMPAGMKLVVKEHIPCIGRRPAGFYERISKMPDVHLVSPFTDGFKWLKNSSLVCSITGTVLWEAMMLGVPALIFGEVHFLNVKEGFVYCPDLSNLTTAIKKALGTSPATDKTLTTYIASIMKNGIEVSSDDMWFEKFADSEKRNKATKQMADKIISNIVKPIS